MSNGNDYSKGFILGALIGGAAGAITALLLAPKSGAELRRELADSSNEWYGKASDLARNMEGKVENSLVSTVNEGKIKAQSIIDTARRQAEDLLSSAETVLQDAKSKAYSTKDQVQDKIENLRDAAKAGADAFKTEIRSSKEL